MKNFDKEKPVVLFPSDIPYETEPIDYLEGWFTEHYGVIIHLIDDDDFESKPVYVSLLEKSFENWLLFDSVQLPAGEFSHEFPELLRKATDWLLENCYSVGKNSFLLKDKE